MGNRGFFGFSRGSQFSYGFSYENVASLVQESNLILWLDALAITGKVNNDPVSQWNDMSGYLNHLTQGTGAQQPLYKTNYLNSQPGLYFDGSDDNMVGPSLNLNSNVARTFIAVARLRNATARSPAFGMGPGGYIIIDANTFSTAGSKWGLYATGDSFDSDAATSLDAVLLTLRINSIVIDQSISANVDYYVNGVKKTLTTKSGDGNWADFTGNVSAVARYPDVGVYGTVDVFEVMVYSRAIADYEIDAASEYLRVKWGLW